jgi:hypothetical protein
MVNMAEGMQANVRNSMNAKADLNAIFAPATIQGPKGLSDRSSEEMDDDDKGWFSANLAVEPPMNKSLNTTPPYKLG